MAVTLDEYVTYPPSIYSEATVGFANNAYSADWSGSEEVVAAVAGKSIYIISISISCSAAINFTVFAAAAGDELWGPVYFLADGNTFVREVFIRPLKVAAATAVEVDGSGAGPATVMIQGFIK